MSGASRASVGSEAWKRVRQSGPHPCSPRSEGGAKRTYSRLHRAVGAAPLRSRGLSSTQDSGPSHSERRQRIWHSWAGHLGDRWHRGRGPVVCRTLVGVCHFDMLASVDVQNMKVVASSCPSSTF